MPDRIAGGLVYKERALIVLPTQQLFACPDRPAFVVPAGLGLAVEPTVPASAHIGVVEQQSAARRQPRQPGGDLGARVLVGMGAIDQDHLGAGRQLVRGAEIRKAVAGKCHIVGTSKRPTVAKAWRQVDPGTIIHVDREQAGVAYLCRREQSARRDAAAGSELDQEPQTTAS